MGSNTLSSNTLNRPGHGDKPLSRQDVEDLIIKTGSSYNLDLISLNLSGIDLSFFDLMGADLTGADLTGANLMGANLTKAILTRANLAGADLTGASLTLAKSAGVDLTGANLKRTILTEIVLEKAILKEADLTGAVVSESDLTDAILERTILTETNLSRVLLRGATLMDAILKWTILTEANLEKADLTGADLTEADLTGADLTGANLTRAILTKANLTGADLTGADLIGATLTGVTLRDADLHQTVVTYDEFSLLATCGLTSLEYLHVIRSRDTLTHRTHEDADLHQTVVTHDELPLPPTLGLTSLEHPHAIRSQDTLTNMTNKTELEICIRILEDPLTAHNVATTLSALSELHKKYSLVEKGRFSDLITYSLNQDVDPLPEEKLVITKLSYDCPIEAHLDACRQGVAKAMGETIRTLITVDLLGKENETEIKDREAQLAIRIQQAGDQHEHGREKELQEGNANNEGDGIELFRRMLVSEIEQLQIERERVLLQEERRESMKKQQETLIELAGKIIDMQQPDLRSDQKVTAIQAYLPTLMKLNQVKGLELLDNSALKRNERCQSV